jgi:16S rRNA (cytidine1402-2'-O)-methyltransferase
MEVQASEMKPGRLTVVTTHIGNPADMTIRAIKSLEQADLVVCEEFKEAVKLLKLLQLKKELISMNEHNEQEQTEKIFYELLNGKNIALISDCGTPGFADPGNLLINKCIDFNIKMDFVHGSNSVLAALVASGFDISRFYFKGFLSPKSDIRKKELRRILFYDKPVILMDTPYRLVSLLNDISILFPERIISLAINLTQKDELILHGTSAEVLEKLKEHFGTEKIKAEFVLVADKKDK